MKIKVLVIDDDHDDFTILQHFLSKITHVEYDVYWSSEFDGAFADILKNEHQIYFIDQYLGKGKGIDLIRNARERGIMKPMILLTGASNDALDNEALKSGASDFIIKNELKPNTLERTLRYSLERFEQSEKLREQEKKYRSLFELSMDSIAIVDMDLTIREFNEVFARSFIKNTIDSPTSLRIFFAFDFDFELLKKKLTTDGYVKNWKTLLHVEGKDKVVMLSVAAMPSNNEQTTFYHVVINDISELIQAQQEVQQLEKLSMTGRMARIIAHEVRNPLTNIHLALGELKELGIEIDDFELYSDMISRNAERIAKLTDDLLSSTRPSEPEIVPACMNEIIHYAIDACSDRINLKHVQLNLELPEEEIHGHWDPEKLKIAFINIMINAIEAMQDVPDPLLHIQLSKVQNNPIIRISDNGKGMDEETVSKIFDPFFSNRSGGMGLGMTATHNIISMHDGKINVQSAPLKGTAFEIIL